MKKTLLTLSIFALALSFPDYSFSQKSSHPEDTNTRIVHTETEVNEILGSYIRVERDSLGYLIYKPCDGRTPRIELSQDSIINYGQIDFPARLKKTKVTEKRESIRMKAENGSVDWRFIWTPVGTDHDLVLVDWKWSTPGGSFVRKGRAVYVNESDAKRLRIVENKCEKGKVSELQFLPIEFE